MTGKINELFVIVSGHTGTGTNSLKLALERLYGQKCYQLNDIITNHPDHLPLWINVFDRQSLDKETCDKLFEGYSAAADYPITLFYKDLLNIYPNAKVILANDDGDSCVKGVRNEYVQINKSNSNPNLQTFLQKIYSKAFDISVSTKLPSDEHMVQSFIKFDENVRRTVPKEKLLEFKIRDGWRPLCKFLGLPEPSEPFPAVKIECKKNHTNWIYYSITIGAFLVFFVSGSIMLHKKYPN